MKKIFLVTILPLLISTVVIGCGSSTNESSNKSTVSITSEDTTESIDEIENDSELLPFGFTPKEFHTNFSNFGSFSAITTNSLQEISNNHWGFSTYSSTGDETTILLISNEEGMVVNISIPSQGVKKGAFPDFAKATLSATDMLLDYDELNESLDFSKVPKTINDFRYCSSHGISISFSSTGFNLTRDADLPNEYSYNTIYSNPKKEDESETDPVTIVSASNESTSSKPDKDSSNANTELTMGMKNALSKAHDYLNYSAFSCSGLIDQLKYEGFSTEEAIYATDNCGADWKEQAAQKALDYLDYSAFSYSGLIDQLEYEGFSKEEATYATDNCGADWNEQAAKKAQAYIDYSSFSRSGLIDQLEYEGFTREQAEYGVESIGY